MAWVAGVIQGLLANMEHDPEQSQWSVVTGTSTGSLLASLAATFDIGDEINMTNTMVDLIGSSFINTPPPAHVSHPWPADVNASDQTGLVNTSVLSQTLVTLLGQRPIGNRMFSISATNDATGKLHVWDEQSMLDSQNCFDRNKWVQYARAAMSDPGLDETVNIDGDVYSSGSVILGTDVFSAVVKCQEAGFTNEDIVVDVVSGNEQELGKWNASTDNVTLKIPVRTNDITSYTQIMQDIFDACDAFPNVSWRYYVEPGIGGLPSDGADYNQTTMQQMIRLGKTDAKEAKMGQHCSIAEAARHSKTVPKQTAESRLVDNDKCFVMTLSGGGAKGAYEAGVIQGLVNRLNQSERQWQYFTGISAGSILSSGAALFDVGQEEDMAKFIVESMMNFTNTNDTVGNVYIDWPEASMQLTESGFFNTTPLFDTLKRMLSLKKLGNRKFTIGSTNDATGQLNLFDEGMVRNEDGSVDVDKFATYVRASAAVPGVFQSVEIDGNVHSDGGVVMGANVFSGINRCLAAGYQESDIVLDLVTCNSDRLPSWNETMDNHALQVQSRAKSIRSFSMEMADIFDACRAYPKVNWRYYVQAPLDLPGTAASFNATILSEMMQVGLSDAKEAQAGVHCQQAEVYRKSNIVRTLRRQQTPSIVV